MDPEEQQPESDSFSKLDDHEYCPQCGRLLESRRCKLVCECGYFMSCSEF